MMRVIVQLPSASMLLICNKGLNNSHSSSTIAITIVTVIAVIFNRDFELVILSYQPPQTNVLEVSTWIIFARCTHTSQADRTAMAPVRPLQGLLHKLGPILKGYCYRYDYC